MFGDPLRAAIARRLIWRITSETTMLVLPESRGLCDVHGELVPIAPRDLIALWHPADRPAAAGEWLERLAVLAIEQPIAQASREVFLADPETPNLDQVVADRRVLQTPFRGFLRGRGWEIPYVGPWFDVPEAKRALTRRGPVAVLQFEADFDADDDALMLRRLHLVSLLDTDLDARTLPPAIVSEAARDILGAATQAALGKPRVDDLR